MRRRLISREHAKLVADAGGLVGVWTHLSDTPLQYAENICALVDVIGVDHVCIGTDTKMTQPTPQRFGPPSGGAPGSQGDFGGPGSQSSPKTAGGSPQGPSPGQKHARAGERTNEAWEGETVGFFYVVVDALLKSGFAAADIGRIGGANYLRVFATATT